MPLPTVPPLDPSAVGLTCGDEIVFHPALLEQPGRAELDPDPAAAALREHLDRAEGAGAPRSGWVRVGQTATEVQFLAPGGGGGWVVAGFFVHDGRWTLASAGECRPEVALPGGVGRAEWRLDPGFPDPAPGDRLVHVLITERACASGRSPEGRVLPPTVATTDEAVLVTILVRGQPGGQDCQGNPEFPVEVPLPEPLGERALYDGAVFPPRGPVTAYTLECGPMEPGACAAWAEELAGALEAEHAGRRVSWISIHDAGGDYDAILDDGTHLTGEGR